MMDPAKGGVGEGSSRRSFLRSVLGGTLVFGALGALSSVVAYLFPPAHNARASDRVRVARVEDLPLNAGKLVLLEGVPTWVVRLKTGYVGLSAICTHKGCIVEWDGTRRVFACPCHRGLFDAHGNVLEGLPRWPLRPARVEVLEGQIYLEGER